MEEINLYDLLRYYVKNWLILLSAVFIGAILGLVFTFFVQKPMYKSEATMLVVSAQTTQDTTLNNNYTELFKSRRVLDSVIRKIDYSGDYQQILDHTTVTNNKDTDVILVSIATTDARKSQELLATSLDVFKEEANSIYGLNNIKIVDSASLPNHAYNVRLLMQLGLSIIATVLLAIIVLFFVYDYYSSQVPPKGKNKPTRNSKPIKTTGKTKAKKTATHSTSRTEKILNTLFKKPSLVAKNKSIATK